MTTSMFDDLARLRAAVDALDLGAVRAQVKTELKGGLKAQVLDGSGRGSRLGLDGTPLPPVDKDGRAGDRHDIFLLGQERHIETGLRNAANTVESVLRAQNAILLAWAPSEDDEGPDDIPGCGSCARFLDGLGRPSFVPVWRAGLCQWCHGFIADFGRRPPVELVGKHLRGERVTLADIRAVLQAPKVKKRRRKKAS